MRGSLWILNVPNAITAGRLALVPVVYVLIAEGWLATAFAAFLIAGLSDALDGYLAKRWQMETLVGAYLDPLADKLLIATVFAALWASGSLAPWVVGIVLARDVLIVLAIGVAWLANRPVAIKPLIVSKLTTASQIALATTVLANLAYGLGMEMLVAALAWSTAVLTLVSLAAYFRSWWHHMAVGVEPAEISKRDAIYGGETFSPPLGPQSTLHAGTISDFDVGTQATNRSLDRPT